MISKNFFKSSLIYSVVGALPYASGVILIPFFTSKLSGVDFGVNALYFSIMYFIQILSTFGLDTYIGIHYFDYKDNKEKLRENIGTVILSLIVLGTFLLIVLSIFGTGLFKVIFDNKYLTFFPWGFITVLTAVFNGFLKTYSGLLINQQRPGRFFQINIVNFILVISVSLFFLYRYPFTLNGPMFGRLIPAAFTFCTVIYYLISEFGFRYNKEMVRKIVSFCTPFVIYALLIWSVSYIDRFIITYFLVDPTFVGIFDFAVKCTLLIDLFQSGLANAISPKIYTIWKDQNLRESTMEVNRYYNGLTAASLLVIPLLSLSFPLLVPLIVKNEIYYQSFAFLGILSIGFAFRGLFTMFISPIFFFKYTRALPKIFFFVAVIQIIVTAFFIKYFGLMGAVWASFITKIVQVLFLYIESRKIFHFKFNYIKQIYLPLICTIVVLILEFLIPQEYLFYNRSFQFILICILVFAVYRKDIRLLPIFNGFLKRGK
jgi:O-antigen/teichoic acid export membrane protein